MLNFDISNLGCIGNVLNEREMGRTFERKGFRNRWKGQQRQMIYVIIHFIIRQNNLSPEISFFL